jgi:hypothetical protein
LQRELNESHRREEDARNSLKSDYENRVSKVIQEKESHEKEISKMLQKSKEDSEALLLEVQAETEAKNNTIEELKETLATLEAEKLEVAEQLNTREKHVVIQEDIIQK